MIVWFIIGGLVAILITEFIAEYQYRDQEKRDREMLKRLVNRED